LLLCVGLSENMILVPFKMSRRTRGYLHQATGLLALFTWLFMGTAEICTPLHEWLHGGAIPDDDDCPVVAVAQGHFDSAVSEVPPVVPVLLTEIIQRVEVTVFVLLKKPLPNDRAPPASYA
jgi:hypothetical protein